MSTLKTIVHFFFRNLHSQVVTIHSKGLSQFFRLLIYLSYFFIFFRSSISSFCAYYNYSEYFEIDVELRHRIYRQARRTHITYFALLYVTLFTARLFCLLYLNVDKVVWEHLYDLIICNEEQIKLQLKRDNQRTTSGWFCQLIVLFRLRFTVHTSSQLKYYPFLEQSLRVRCLLAYYVFELMTTLFLSYIASLFVNYIFIVGSFWRWLNDVQRLFYIVVIFTFILYSYFNYVLYFLVPLILYLVCYIYAIQYRKVNRKLTMLMGKLKSTEEGGDDQINQFSSKFRTSHTHLTVFILRYNNSIVSKVIAYYLHYVLPFHAYCIVYNVFRQSNLSRKTAIYNVLVMSLLWFFLMVITIVVAKVNDEICKSGPILGSVFAKKGVLMFSKRRRLSSIWVANSETSWSREAIKLATCYEMIWRVDNQLTFTAGQMNLTMNWSFIWELTYLYTSFVFLFCGKFVSKDDDYM